MALLIRQSPRAFAIDRNGLAINDNVIPAGIKTATAELAYFLLQHDVTDPRQEQALHSLTSRKIGEAADSYNPTKAIKRLPNLIMDSLKPFLVEKSSFDSLLNF